MAGPARHSDAVKYIVYVFWLRGHTEIQCAVAAGLRKKQVAGLIAKSPYANRTAMSDEERQQFLSGLEEIRFADGPAIDGGRLRPAHFRIFPLEREQRRVRTG
jgi:hypothetical protein